MGNCFLHGNGGDGNERNIFVKAYASKNALLEDTPKSNTIGVVTSVNIYAMAIQPSVPGKTEGNVWVKDNATAWQNPVIQTIASKSSPKIYVPVFPSGCMQYINGAWKTKIAYFYKGGTWEKFSDVIAYVYNAGTTSLSWSGSGTDTSSALVMETKHANYSGSYRSGGWKGSTGKTTVPSWATKLCMKYSVSVTTGSFSSLTNTAFGLRSSALSSYENGNTNFSAYKNLSSGSNVTVSVPITTAMQGSSYYIGFHANTGSYNNEVISKWTVSKIWFE